LGSNVTRIAALESGDLTIGGEKTFSSNLEVGGNLDVQGTILGFRPMAIFYRRGSTNSGNHQENIRTGWVAFTGTYLTTPGLIESHSLTNTGTNYTTNSASSGQVVKLLKTGLYKFEYVCSIQTQTGISSHIGIYPREVSTNIIPGNTGIQRINNNEAFVDSYIVKYGSINNVYEYFSKCDYLQVTSVPAYAYIYMQPNSNDATHFRFAGYGTNSVYAALSVFYLGEI
jgi:hypothetical protein